MKILRFASLIETPWKNGGGTTTEIAVHPAGATLETFDWRLSIARVGGDGPFSLFEGIDRTLTLIEGVGMRLDIDGAPSQVLTTRSAPLAFPGDVPVTARLIDGPIRDLNVMTRRGRWRHGVARANGGAPLPAGPLVLVFCLATVVVSAGDIRAELGFGDIARLERGGGEVMHGEALIVTLQPQD